MGMLDGSELRMWAIVLVLSVALVGIGAFVGLPLLDGTLEVLNQGLSLKSAALWSFGITMVLFVVFAITAGDGIIGELQFMIGGFFAFFVVITMLIAWIF